MKNEKIPSHFVSLQENGFACKNYYTGEGGIRIGITTEFIKSIGFVDDTIWIHPRILPKLTAVKDKLYSEGFGLIIKDGFRPVELITEVCRLREEAGLPVKKLMSQKKMPHATGMAVDAMLADISKDSNDYEIVGKELITRNQRRDGLSSCFVDFYNGMSNPECVNYQNLQNILVRTFLREGFVLGNRREYWHFELPLLFKEKRY